MLKRLSIVIAVVVGIVFVPYWVGVYVSVPKSNDVVLNYLIGCMATVLFVISIFIVIALYETLEAGLKALFTYIKKGE